MRTALFFILLAIASCGQKPPLSKADYEISINRWKVAKYEDISSLMKRGADDSVIRNAKRSWDFRIDSLAREEQRWYK